MGTLTLVALGVLGWWLLHCWRWPYVTCKHCDGQRREDASDGEHWRDNDCAFCMSKGTRYRWELRWLTLF